MYLLMMRKEKINKGDNFIKFNFKVKNEKDLIEMFKIGKEKVNKKLLINKYGLK